MDGLTSTSYLSSSQFEELTGTEEHWSTKDLVDRLDSAAREIAGIPDDLQTPQATSAIALQRAQDLFKQNLPQDAIDALQVVLDREEVRELNSHVERARTLRAHNLDDPKYSTDILADVRNDIPRISREIVKALVLRTKAQFSLEYHDDFIKGCETVYAADPKISELFYLHAQILHKETNYRLALAKGLLPNERTTKLTQLIADCYLKTGNIAMAYYTIREDISSETETDREKINEWFTCLQTCKKDLSVESFQEEYKCFENYGLELGPKEGAPSNEVFIYRALLLLSLGKTEEAQATLSNLFFLKNNPNYASTAKNKIAALQAANEQGKIEIVRNLVKETL